MNPKWIWKSKVLQSWPTNQKIEEDIEWMKRAIRREAKCARSISHQYFYVCNKRG